MELAEVTYMIIAVDELEKVKFEDILQTSPETMRYSVDNTLTVISWEGKTPDFVADLEYTKGPYTHAEIMPIMNSAEWFKTPENV